MSYSPKAAAFLANIAYTDSDDDVPRAHDFQTYLDRIPAGPETNGPWSLVWGPAENDGIVLYVAKGADGSLCVAFRGTNADENVTGFFENIFADLDVADPVPWLYPERPLPNEPTNASTDGPRISAGTNQALALAAAAVDPSRQLCLLDVLREAIRDTDVDITVTGHSLGGGLAVVATAWLLDQVPKTGGPAPRLFPCTFAAPTIANEAFSKWFGERFPDYAAFVNTNDVVPMAWGDLGGILATYPGFLDVPTILVHEPLLAAAVEAANLELADTYRPIRPKHPLPFTATLLATHSWTEQATGMHSMERTYFSHVTGHSWEHYMTSSVHMTIRDASPAPMRRKKHQLV